jgi:hypothetical protein
MEREIIIDEPEPDAVRRQSFLSRIRGRLPGLPLLRSSEALIDQAEAAKFEDLEGRFAVMALPLEDEGVDEAVLKSNVASLRQNGVIGSNTVVEGRLLMPEDAIRPKTVANGLAAMGVVKAELDDPDEAICMVQNSSAITPIKRIDSPADPVEVLSEIDSEHRDLSRQIRSGPAFGDAKTNVFTLGFTQPNYAQQIFGSRLVFGMEALEAHQPAVLTRLGAQSRDLVLAPPFPRRLATDRV